MSTTDLNENRAAQPGIDAIESLHDAIRSTLLSARNDAGHWEGELSSSALSTATAIVALDLVRRHGQGYEGERLAELVRGGVDWLIANANDDGGFGDTAESPTNISTTTLAWAALSMHEGDAIPGLAAAIERADAWLRNEIGGAPTATTLADTISRRYGIDRTFSVPILVLCALAGRFGDGPEAWQSIPRLPFELAALPHACFSLVGLPVVSYALPALIAIGQTQQHNLPTRNPFAALARKLTKRRTLTVLRRIQPSSGGYLEATPLTSFVTLSLAGCGLADHAVARSAVEFLDRSVRPDGSWPIDTNLATWVTTLSMQALAAGEGGLAGALDEPVRDALRGWLLAQQTKVEHPYTHAAPGAFAWTDLPGGVPDADDTPGALLALAHLRDAAGAATQDAELRDAARNAVGWLLDLQNRDGGIPTFCRGWGKLPFDQSSPDLTAHALRAWQAWRATFAEDASLAKRMDQATDRACRYLIRTQADDGPWTPLWFGNQHTSDQSNPVYGTARVLACAGIAPTDAGLVDSWREAHDRAARWLLDAQRTDGGFGGAAGSPPSIEETALAIDGLARYGLARRDSKTLAHDPFETAITAAVAFLDERTDRGRDLTPAPIGLYFAKLWYTEALYPHTFTLAALAHARRYLARTSDDARREGGQP